MALFASSYIPTVATAVTRNADSLSFAFAAAPEALSVYVRLVELNADANGTYTYLNIGSAARSYFILFYQAVGYKAQFAGVTSTLTSNIVGSPVGGSTIELLGTLSATGSAQITLARAGTVTVGGATAASGVPQAWSAGTLYCNAQVTSIPNVAAYTHIVIVRGVQPLGTMQRLAGTN
jgi:hypothetical protein